MKSFLTALSMAAALSVTFASTSVSAATPDEVIACDTEFAACLANAAKGSELKNSLNENACFEALAACKKNPN